MSAYSDLILAKASLSGYWRMAEASGTTLTDSGPNGLTGTLPGSGVTYSVTGALVNDPDTALTFNGTASTTVADNNALDVADGPFWYSFWLKRSSTQNANQTLTAKGTSTPQLRFNTSNQIVLLSSGVGAVARSSNSITDTTTWHHVVLTKNGSAIGIYIDGVDVTVITTPRTLADSASALVIGGAAASEFFPGSMDEFAIGKGAVLSADEVLELYRTGAGLIGPATETDTAQALDKDKHVTLGVGTETDTAQALSVTKTIFKTVTPATETDEAQALDFDKPILKSLTPATETDEAQTLSRGDAQNVDLTPASETDEAQPLGITHTHYVSITPVEETDSAQALSHSHEITTAQIGTRWRQRLPESQPQYVSIEPVDEYDDCVPLTVSKRATLQAADLPMEVAAPLSFVLRETREVVKEVEVVREVFVPVPAPTPPPVSAPHQLSLMPAMERDTAYPLSYTQIKPQQDTDAEELLLLLT